MTVPRGGGEGASVHGGASRWEWGGPRGMMVPQGGVVAISTVRGFPTADAIEKIASLAKNFGGRSGIEIQATPIVVSMSGSNHGSHFNFVPVANGLGLLGIPLDSNGGNSSGNSCPPEVVSISLRRPSFGLRFLGFAEKTVVLIPLRPFTINC
ncbi:hypothetical protein H5410_006401 [Solanum commersonii]|uniref:Uncharacterized protein n=1 Tax=Solanum commersonii TaxID=4109 RepID=A0A9J6AB75_SOLCO|nr:hypothetical protein H5410_006401 [Solanum commersonii]